MILYLSFIVIVSKFIPNNGSMSFNGHRQYGKLHKHDFTIV